MNENVRFIWLQWLYFENTMSCWKVDKLSTEINELFNNELLQQYFLYTDIPADFPYLQLRKPDWMIQINVSKSRVDFFIILYLQEWKKEIEEQKITLLND